MRWEDCDRGRIAVTWILRTPGMARGGILAVWRASLALVVNSLHYFAGLGGLEVGTSWEVSFPQQKPRII